jgi:hypothetical protein
MAGYEEFAIKKCCTITYLDDTLPTQEEQSRILDKTNKAERYCFKTSKDMWLNQVKDEWDRFMFSRALDWDGSSLPAEVEKKLAEPEAHEEGAGRQWFRLANPEMLMSSE